MEKPAVESGDSPSIRAAYELLRRSVITLNGKPVGTVAAVAEDLPAANYGECFIRDFVPFIQGPIRINYTVPGLILFYVWLYFPYTFLTTLAALEGLDPAIEEAARVSGADRWQVLRHVVLPLITPGILSGSVLTFMAAFGAFSIPLVAGGDHRPLSVEVYKQIDLFIPARWSRASATAVLMGAMQIAFLSLYMRFLRRET